MVETGRTGKPIWAGWRVRDDGSVEVAATYDQGGGSVQREFSFANLAEAVEVFGPGFGDVVTRATEAGSNSGRWRP
ncbi:MAG: hypothetical protein JSV86_09265 [Gemmatimonadota bacterium]|nr:MAG: hypothetical protein JSV86_09265 [Gemmatimonadota bacterium]